MTTRSILHVRLHQVPLEPPRAFCAACAPPAAPVPVLDSFLHDLRQAADDIAARRTTALDLLHDGELLDTDLLTTYGETIDAVETHPTT